MELKAFRGIHPLVIATLRVEDQLGRHRIDRLFEACQNLSDILHAKTCNSSGEKQLGYRITLGLTNNPYSTYRYGAGPLMFVQRLWT